MFPRMDIETIRELWRYNDWANERLLEAVLGLTPEQFRRELGGSFPSVQATLTHIMWAEWLWLERWRGRPAANRFSPADFPTSADVAARWQAIRNDQAQYAASVEAGQLQRPLRYVNLRGEVWEYPLWRQMYHLLNHSSYHRGQITHMLRQLEVQPPTTDFLNFRDANAQK